jgi:hypothetical protein
VSQDDKDVSLGDLTTDAGGNQFATVSVESNGPPVILYDAGLPGALKSAKHKALLMHGKFSLGKN